MSDAPPPTGFARTLETAANADGIATLLARVAKAGAYVSCSDARRLEALAAHYRAYATALREAVAPQAASADEQLSLLDEAMAPTGQDETTAKPLGSQQ